MGLQRSCAWKRFGCESKYFLDFSRLSLLRWRNEAVHGTNKYTEFYDRLPYPSPQQLAETIAWNPGTHSKRPLCYTLFGVDPKP